MSGSGACVLRGVSLCSPVGELVLSGCDRGVHSIDIKVGTENKESVLSDGQSEMSTELQRCVDWIQCYFINPESVSSLPLPALHHPLLQSDSFTSHVLWTLFKEVGLGKTVSYKQLAEMSGNPKAVRAVGGAMRRNPIPLIVPCHRVLCSSGQSGRYMGGKGDDIKVWLLTHEKKALEST
ncbi:methylated-DNA--protein-cysteine methyltransferase isoform X1 [Myxocyprinus asiaticus]|uniref:methylated-DNA--protein-cysteine methyltransferase isoform X1 n=1 Tax=Myxocyprinus asiaticus TaxID=70543 RepID=UPI0022226888|nr:methylated-DNA--protein-cysteine methyltransferase isoform X1 [Myxocyprinus asiaticus]